MSKKEKPDHVFPENLLAQISENTLGHVLFTINKDGEPEIFCNFDNSITMFGLHGFIKHFANAIESIDGNSVFESIVGEDEDDPDDD